MTKCIESLDDFYGPLSELKELVEAAIEEHGEDAMVDFFAGSHNVEVIIRPTIGRVNKKEFE